MSERASEQATIKMAKLVRRASALPPSRHRPSISSGQLPLCIRAAADDSGDGDGNERRQRATATSDGNERLMIDEKAMRTLARACALSGRVALNI